jgi:hypothetical protein
VALLESQAATRVPDLVPIRYGRMMVSAFTFYRGAALIMASDLASTPLSGLTVQACGDAHMSNFGVFASAERTLVFDVNDFDETLPGPWEWDMKHLAASLVIAGRERGFSDKERSAVVVGTAGAYRTEMATLAGMRDLDVWYERIDIESVLRELGGDLDLDGGKSDGKQISKLKARADKQLAKARRSHWRLPPVGCSRLPGCSPTCSFNGLVRCRRHCSCRSCTVTSRRVATTRSQHLAATGARW